MNTSRKLDEFLFGSMLGVWTAFALFGLISTTGCTSTVIPQIPEATQASFDGGIQNSGVIDFQRGTNGHITALIVTGHWRARFNAMVMAGCGKNLLPPPVIDEGLTPYTNGTYLAIPDTQVFFARMNLERKKGQP